jgi:RNA polymerase sigma-70 factor (ECF subfamily)
MFRGLLIAEAHGRLPRNLGAKERSSDLVQDTFLEAQRDFASFRGHSEDELKKWLCRILEHNIQNTTRRYATGKRQVERELPRNGPDPEDGPPGEFVDRQDSPSGQAATREETDLLREAFARLGDDEKTVIQLRHHQSKPFEEIGIELGISAEAARKRFTRAVEALQTEFERMLGKRRHRG